MMKTSSSASRSPRIAPGMVVLAALVLSACHKQSEVKGPDDFEAPKTKVTKLERMTVRAHTTEELLSKFERARSWLLVDRYLEARDAFNELIRIATDPEIVSLSLFNRGVAQAALGESERALESYAELLERFPKASIVPATRVRQTRLLGHLERWKELEAASEQLLAIGKALPVMDRIEALGAKALALVEQQRDDDAERYVNRARDLIDKHRFGRAGTPPVQLAQVAFAEGEVRRLRSERIHLTPVPPNFAEVLERRCQGLLDAQAAYTEAMRSRDAHWSAMSGYRIGQLYQQLHREAMRIPPPAAADTLRKKQLFEGAMRLRYRILLEKGLKMMDATMRMAERTQESSYWVTRARDAQRQLVQSLEDERTAMKKLPYTEDEFRAALDKLKGKKKSASP